MPANDDAHDFEIQNDEAPYLPDQETPEEFG